MSTAAQPQPKALRNVAFSGTRMVVSAAGSLIVSIITARTLGAQQMGIYSFVTWIAGTISSLSSLGLSMAITKFVAEHKSASRHALAVRIAQAILLAQIALSGAASLLAAGVWPLLARQHLIVILLALAAVTPGALQQTLLALMEGVQRFDLQVAATLGGVLLQIAIVSGFALAHVSVVGFLVASLLSSIALAGLTFLLCRPMLSAGGEPSDGESLAEHARHVFNFSLSVYALWFLSLIVFDKSELFFLRYFKASEELAYYSIAFTLAARLATASDSISNVLFPMFVARYTQGGADGLRDIYRRSMRYIQILMVPVYIWGIPLTPCIMNFFYGPQYAHVASVLQVLLATMLFTMLMPTTMIALFAMDRQLSFLRYLVLVSVLNLLLDLALIPHYGAMGAALANGVSQALAVCGPLMVLHKSLPGAFPFFAAFRIYLAGAVSVVPVFYAALAMHAGAPALCASVALAAVIYLALLTGLRALTGSDVAALKDSMISLVSRRTE